MLLHRIHLNSRCREVRRDLADPYEMHSTLCRAFVAPEQRAQSAFLWRLEPETDSRGNARLIVQSREEPNWERIGIADFFSGLPDPPLNFSTRLGLESLRVGESFRFRIRANPCVTKAGKRLGLMQQEDQIAWIKRKGENHGFEIHDVQTSEDRILVGRRRNTDSVIKIFSVLFDGFISVKDPPQFRDAIYSGIGHGKAMGLGLLSIVPAVKT